MSNSPKKRILMVLENGGYPEDTRVYLEATALAKAGHQVSVVCRRGWKHRKTHETFEGVHIYRYPAPPDSKSLWGYLWEYGYSFFVAWLISMYLLIRHGFDVIHIHMPPDLNGLLGVFYKLLGKKFVMDHHDLSPELYLAQSRKEGFLYRWLLRFERISCRWADRLISTNETQRRTAIERCGARPERCTVVRNGPAEFFLSECTPIQLEQKRDRLVIGFVGEMGEQDGVVALIRAFHILKTELGRTNFLGLLVGSGRSLAEVKRLVEEFHLEDHVLFTGSIPFHMVPSHIASFDIGATPDLSNPYTDSCTTIKTMEYMAMGKPIVSFATKENQVTAMDSALYAENNDERAFAEALAKLMDDPELRQRLGQFGRRRVEESLAWVHQSQRLVDLYASL